MKTLGLILLTAFLSCYGMGQETWIKTIKSPEDEQLISNQILDENLRLFSYMHRVWTSNPTYYSQYLEYSKKYFLTDDNLNHIDSLDLDALDGYLLSPLRFVNFQNDTILLFGSVLDTTTYDEQFCLIWLDEQLNIINNSVYGSLQFNEQMAGYTRNSDNNYVFFRSYPIIEGDYESVHYIFWEFGFDGQEKSLIHDTVNTKIFTGLEDYPYISRYVVPTPNELLHFSYDFELLDQFDIQIPSETPYRSTKYNDSLILFLGDHFIYGQPPAMESDLAFIITDLHGEIILENFYGVIDTLDRSPKVSFINEETFYVGGTKNFVSGLEDSWYSLYKSDFDGSISMENYYGGNGKYILRYVEAMDDGGIMLSGHRWDFYNFPTTSQYDIVIIKVDSNGLISSTNEFSTTSSNNPIYLYPNPGKDKLMIESQMPNLTFSLFASDGNLVYMCEFSYDEVINTDGLRDGVYCYQIFSGKDLIKSGKWIKIK